MSSEAKCPFTGGMLQHTRSGSKGNFTNLANDSIGRITTSGVVTNYTTGTDSVAIIAPQSITSGPNGTLWFTNTLNGAIGRITTSGVITEYSGTGIDQPYDITSGPDGALWFTNFYNN